MLPTGLKQLVLEKQQADELAAALARERAKEDAEFAAAEAAAAALEWEKVYVVRTEREEAVKRAEEAEEKLRKVAHDAAMRSANCHFPFSQSKAPQMSKFGAPQVGSRGQGQRAARKARRCCFGAAGEASCRETGAAQRPARICRYSCHLQFRLLLESLSEWCGSCRRFV